MKDFRKHLVSFSVFLSIGFLVLLLACLFSGEASALQNGGLKKRVKTPAPVPKTGQTISYAVGDDGDLQKGIAWPVPRFKDNENGTVTDILTGLMWIKDLNQVNPASYYLNWYDSLTTCQDLVFAGYSDWRLPNIMELGSLVNYGKFPWALPDGHPFLGIQDGFHWSSTTQPDSTISAMAVLFFYGKIASLNKNSVEAYSRVWPVRGGTN